MEVHHSHIIDNTIRPHQAPAGHTPKQAYLTNNQPQDLPNS